MTMRFHDENIRRRWQNPEEILAEIGLRSRSTFVDLGCGTGFFAIPAAKIVGMNGKIYCLDSNPHAIKRLKEKATQLGLGNLFLKVGEAEDTILCEGCADIVFFGIVLHDFDDPTKVLENAKKMLKPTGRLINLDWKKEVMDLGPPYEIRFSEDKARELITDAGFVVESVKESGTHHYVIIARL